MSCRHYSSADPNNNNTQPLGDSLQHTEDVTQLRQHPIRPSISDEAPIPSFHLGGATACVNNYHGLPVTYPELPQQSWSSIDQTPSQIATYSSPAQHKSPYTKRKRESFEHVNVPMTRKNSATSDVLKSVIPESAHPDNKRSRNSSTEFANHIASASEITNPATPCVPRVRACLKCNRLSSSWSCRQCHKVPYCSEECQVSDWPRHYAYCSNGIPDHGLPQAAEGHDLQRAAYPDPQLARGFNLQHIPGAYPESSQEVLSGLPSKEITKPTLPSSSESLQMSTLPASSPGQQPETPAVPTPEEPPLCSEQAELVELICSGRNVFYTGSAGCGKSTVLKAFTKRLRDMGKKVQIVAPTGCAALQVNGKTLWSYAGWAPAHMKEPLSELKSAAHGKLTWRRLTQETDVIVFDEISMVENHLFERLNEVMKEAWYDPRREEQPAFGGVQVVVTGDFLQLPPVKPFQYCIQCGKELIKGVKFGRDTHTCQQHGVFRDEDKWAFSSKAWHECNFAHVNLKQIHRQNDREFIRMLQKCRIGDPLSSQEIDTLMDHKCQVHHATRLYPKKEQVANYNQSQFKKLIGATHWYWCRDVFIWRRDLHPTLGNKGLRSSRGPSGPDNLRPLSGLQEHRFNDLVELKKGMLVVLLVNLDLDAGLCNGSQGLICGFQEVDPAKLPKAKTSNKHEPENRIMGDLALMKEREIKAFIESKGARYKYWPVVRFHNGMTRVVYANCSISELGDKKPYSLLARTQIPLAPAWALTIHKSQGMTLDRVIVNVSNAFEEGQIYVALSRATGLSTLKIEGERDNFTKMLAGNREVQRFLREKFGALNAV